MTELDVDLRHHGDLDATPGLIDLAVNVRAETPPRWLLDAIAAVDLARYPEQRAALAAVAGRHGRDVGEVLLTNGAAEAFVLVARALQPRHAVVVHPQFTEPETALRAAGHVVDRLVLAPPFLLDPGLIPDDADLVALGNPTNPTSVLHPAATVRALVRPGRTVVVDEAFADCVAGERESVAGDGDLAGLIVVRSLTKTWGLAGLRAGYVLAGPATIDRLRAAQPLWPVNASALAACVACSSERATADTAAWLQILTAERAHLVAALRDLGADVVPEPAASFVLARFDRSDLVPYLRTAGFAVRRGDTFPGLGPQWMRIAVRDPITTDRFADALRSVLAGAPHDRTSEDGCS